MTSSGSTGAADRSACDNDTSTCKIAVIAAVIERNGCYLICRRPVHKRHGGLWEFPGGKLEPGESLLQAATRELREELALQVVSVGPVRFCKNDGDSAFVVNFVDVAVDGDPQPLEHSAIRWCPAAELLQLPLAPIDCHFVKSLRSTL